MTCVEGEIYLENWDLSPEDLNSDVSIIEHAQLGKLLKTGEWGRRQGDGSLEFLGKAHRIVTLKGQRINLQRIEQALLTVVKDCYVMLRNQKLVAYVVKQGNVSPEFLNNHLKSELPGYPIPYTYVPVSTLPLTGCGEVDVQTLGRGKPRVHGDKFKLNDSITWPEPAETIEEKDSQVGYVKIRIWHNFHSRKSPLHPMKIILV